MPAHVGVLRFKEFGLPDLLKTHCDEFFQSHSALRYLRVILHNEPQSQPNNNPSSNGAEPEVSSTKPSAAIRIFRGSISRSKTPLSQPATEARIQRALSGEASFNNS